MSQRIFFKISSISFLNVLQLVFIVFEFLFFFLKKEMQNVGYVNENYST